jgi:hypothetical protein
MGLRYPCELLLNPSFNEQFVLQSSMPLRISDTACSKGISSEG